MIPTHKKLAWGQRYQQRRGDGEPGWAGDDSYRRKQAQIEEALQGQPQPVNSRFLELGCGAGNITLWMAEQGYESYGIDIIPEAIEWANERMNACAAIANFRVGDIANMEDFPDDFFGIIFDADCFHMIIDDGREACFAEVRRVLRPGGLFIRGQNARDDRIAHRVEFAQGTAYFEPHSRCIFIEGRPEYLLLSEQELIQEVTNAGFNVLRVIHRPAEGTRPFLSGWVDIHASKT
ncbi:MAG: class I SAM-dependent methyltransferase [Abitibacteriaceae bacterium]|nr:class I SAM-dependent methyltransferase [Abditibacteriaceae bacterium]MBV9866724.1 class I SAM-dependent methyltransferase [Abditibacteriaceae bacterium]